MLLVHPCRVSAKQQLPFRGDPHRNQPELSMTSYMNILNAIFAPQKAPRQRHVLGRNDISHSAVEPRVGKGSWSPLAVDLLPQNCSARTDRDLGAQTASTCLGGVSGELSGHGYHFNAQWRACLHQERARRQSTCACTNKAIATTTHLSSGSSWHVRPPLASLCLNSPAHLPHVEVKPSGLASVTPSIGASPFLDTAK